MRLTPRPKAPRFKVVILSALGALVLAAPPGRAATKKKKHHTANPTATSTSSVTEIDEARPIPPSAPTVVVEKPAEVIITTTPAATAATTMPSSDRTAPPSLSAPLNEAHAVEGMVSAQSSMARQPMAERVGAHVGVASPLVTLRASNANRKVTSLGDDLTLVAPIGLGIKLGDAWTFDFEVQVATGVRPEGLTTMVIDPGLLHSWGRVAAGLRVGWQLNVNQNIGLIPLVNIGLVHTRTATWFVEAEVPSFVQNKQLTTSASLQTGVGF